MRLKFLTFLMAALIGAEARGAVMLDFETAGQYSNNFRKIAGPGNPTQTGPSDDNDYVTLTGTSNFTAVHDTSPGDSTERTSFTVSPGSPLTFSADLRFATNTSSFGLYIVDATNEAAGYLALLNFNQTVDNELIRFASNAVPNTGGAGTLVAGDSGNVIAPNEFANVTFTYSIDVNNHPVLSVTAGSLSDSITFETIDAPLTNVELAVRVSSQGAGINDFDNVNIQGVLIPEPASLGLLGWAALLLTRRRRGLA